MKRAVGVVARLGALVLALAAAFTAGVALAPRLQQSLPALPFLPGTTITPPDTRTQQALSIFQEAWRLIDRDYYGKPASEQAMAQGAIQGLVNALDDPYSAYLTEDEMASAQSELAGDLQSLGLAVEKRDDSLIVVAPLSASPAHNAGIVSGDRIVRIDGRETASLTLGEAVQMLRGPAGSNVVLTLQRSGAPLDVSLQRKPITGPLLQAQVLPDGIAYVNVSLLGSPVPRLLSSFLQQNQGSSLRGMILDLRNDPGGYLDVAVEMAGQFISDGVIVTQQGHSGAYTWSYTDQGRTLVVDGPDGRKTSPMRNWTLAEGTPLAVLVNRGTASAAEVLAAALQDRGRAILIGERTFGKGAVSGDYTLSDGSGLHLTNGQWLSPKGRSVANQGLIPDIAVTDTANANSSGQDPVLARAKEYLLNKR